MTGLLDRIKGPNDIKKIEAHHYDELAQELRDYILDTVSENGGHLASNLGAVELTIALHLCLDFPSDKLIWDVGHQSYAHKILTGRKEEFRTIRQFGGLSGFPKKSESPCDVFNTGHSSTSISAALGMAKARDIMGRKETVACVIGDGSMTGGMAYEALNNVSRLKSNLIIILNDNKMSISENVGGLSRYLTSLRTKKSYIDFKIDVKNKLKSIPKVGNKVVKNVKRSKDSITQIFIGDSSFGSYGIKYIGPIDGHDIGQMVQAISAAKRLDEPVIVHVVTKKGKGYIHAEEKPQSYHGIGAFDIETGKGKAAHVTGYTDVFSRKLVKLADIHPDICAICAAMPEGTGLHRFAKKYPDRYFDVGIAEQHAVTFAAGMAAEGLKPYVAVYSSFLQRAFDQILEDVCMQKLPVVLCLDRAGIVGADGETHHGIFDLSYLGLMPGMTICAPKNRYELSDMLEFAYDHDGPVAIRYPRGKAYTGCREKRQEIVHGKSEVIYSGKDAVIFAVGEMVETAVAVRSILAEDKISCSIVNARFVKPVDEECLLKMADEFPLIVTMEDNVYRGGYGEACALILKERGSSVKLITVTAGDEFVPHGSPSQLKELLKMDEKSIADKIRKAVVSARKDHSEAYDEGKA